MKFDYNFRKCHICDKKIDSGSNINVKCPNGCCEYNVDPQGEIVDIMLFNNEDLFFIAPLYEKSNFDAIHDPEYEKELHEELKKYLKAIAYYRENNRYLVELMK